MTTIRTCPPWRPASIAFGAALALMAGCSTAKLNTTYGQLQPGDAPLGSKRPSPGTTVPLPPGNWVELDRQVAPSIPFEAGRTINLPMVQTSWGLVEQGKLSVLLVVQANETRPPISYIPVMDPTCRAILPGQDRFVFYQAIGSEQANNQNCMTVRYRRLSGAPADGIAQNAIGAAQRYGGLPTDAINVFYSAAIYGNLMNYSVYYFPERDNAQLGVWSEGSETPAQRDYVSALVRWSLGFRHWIIDGTKNQL